MCNERKRIRRLRDLIKRGRFYMNVIARRIDRQTGIRKRISSVSKIRKAQVCKKWKTTLGTNISEIYIHTGIGMAKGRELGGGKEWERSESTAKWVSASGSSLLHFKPKRSHSSGFRRADVLYYCSVEIAILRLHSGPRACMHRTQASLFQYSRG